MAYLTSTTEQHNKRFDDLMETIELFKINWKGKESVAVEEGSSTKTIKQMGSKNTGYPPGFVPHTPTYFATHNEFPPWEDARRNKTGFVASFFGENEFTPDSILMQNLSLQDQSKVRPPTSINRNSVLTQSVPYTAPQTQSAPFNPQQPSLPPLLQ